MKKINIVLFSLCFVLFLGVVLCGCDVSSVDAVLVTNTAEVEDTEPTVAFDFELIGFDKNNFSSSDFSLYRDTVTDVLYVIRSGGYKGGLTVMLDPDTGLPLTYTRYLELKG